MRDGIEEANRMIQDGSQLSDETILSLKKLEYDYLIARLGLQGTLWGAWGSLVVITLIVVSPTFTPRSIIKGWQIVAIVVSMVFAIAVYGSFIFKHYLSVAARISGLSLGTSVGTAPGRPGLSGDSTAEKLKLANNIERARSGHSDTAS